MSLYRQAGGARRRRRLSLAIGVLTIAAVVVVVLLLSDSGPPTHADRVASARASATRVLDELEILGIEYRQAVKSGRAAEPTKFEGSEGHLARMRSELTGHAADYRAVSAAGYARARAALGAVAAAVAARAPITSAAARFRAALARY